MKPPFENMISPIILVGLLIFLMYLIAHAPQK